jgi:hypothetical protein
MPALQKAREQAMQSSCLNNQKQLGTTLMFYANDYDDFFPPVGTTVNPLDNHWPLVLASPDWMRTTDGDGLSSDHLWGNVGV